MRTGNISFILSSLVVIAALGCNAPAGKVQEGKTDSSSHSAGQIPDASGFDQTVDGKSVKLYTLKNKDITVAITNYGGRIVSLVVPDKKGALQDVVLGYKDLKTYQKPKEPYFGALIGRYGNRIAKGKFMLNGKACQLDINDGVNTLHGGFKGFFSQVWAAKQINAATLELSLNSKDGEGGYPGNLSVKVTYSLTADRALKISYNATSDKNTVLNLTNHAYFNLSGAGSKTITDHTVQINASTYTPVDTTLIPTGRLESVTGTPFDFTKARLISAGINDKDQQLKNGKGYDHNFVLLSNSLPAAVVSSPLTGIKMEVFTIEPGLQFYTGNFLTGKDADGKGGAAYGYRSAFCMETQHFPDSPNQPSFPSTLLKPGTVYSTNTTYRFSIL